MKELTLESIKVQDLERLKENKNNSIEASSVLEIEIYELLDHRAAMNFGQFKQLEHYTPLEAQLLWYALNNSASEMSHTERVQRFADVFERKSDAVSGKFYKIRNSLKEGESLEVVCTKKRGQRGLGKKVLDFGEHSEQQLIEMANLNSKRAIECLNAFSNGITENPIVTKGKIYFLDLELYSKQQLLEQAKLHSSRATDYLNLVTEIRKRRA